MSKEKQNSTGILNGYYSVHFVLHKHEKATNGKSSSIKQKQPKSSQQAASPRIEIQEKMKVRITNYFVFRDLHI